MKDLSISYGTMKVSLNSILGIFQWWILFTLLILKDSLNFKNIFAEFFFNRFGFRSLLFCTFYNSKPGLILRFTWVGTSGKAPIQWGQQSGKEKLPRKRRDGEISKVFFFFFLFFILLFFFLIYFKWVFCRVVSTRSYPESGFSTLTHLLILHNMF
jgi:hypothetical protein